MHLKNQNSVDSIKFESLTNDTKLYFLKNIIELQNHGKINITKINTSIIYPQHIFTKCIAIYQHIKADNSCIKHLNQYGLWDWVTLDALNNTPKEYSVYNVFVYLTLINQQDIATNVIKNSNIIKYQQLKKIINKFNTSSSYYNLTKKYNLALSNLINKLISLSTPSLSKIVKDLLTQNDPSIVKYLPEPYLDALEQDFINHFMEIYKK